jgi:hypothetical protein
MAEPQRICLHILILYVDQLAQSFRNWPIAPEHAPIGAPWSASIRGGIVHHAASLQISRVNFQLNTKQQVRSQPGSRLTEILPMLAILLHTLRDLVRPRRDLLLENLALRQ